MQARTGALIVMAAAAVVIALSLAFMAIGQYQARNDERQWRYQQCTDAARLTYEASIRPGAQSDLDERLNYQPYAGNKPQLTKSLKTCSDRWGS